MVRFSIANPSILAKLDLPEPKKPDTQMATLVRLVRRLAVSVEDARVVLGDRVGDDVLVDLVADDLSSVWSTLMTSSMRRSMSLAKRS
jgi:hypothetical protein